MKKLALACMLLSTVAIDAGAAFAQTQAPQPDAKSGPQVRYQKTTRFDFDNDEVEASPMRPNGDVVDGIRKLRQSSLVQARTNFKPEMLKSVESM